MQGKCLQCPNEVLSVQTLQNKIRHDNIATSYNKNKYNISSSHYLLQNGHRNDLIMAVTKTVLVCGGINRALIIHYDFIHRNFNVKP